MSSINGNVETCYIYSYTYLTDFIEQFPCSLLVANYITPCIGHNPPTLRLLHAIMNVTGFCTRWYDLGIQLLEERNGVSILNEIRSDYPNARRRCIIMFEKWLERQPHPSWNQLLTALINLDMNSAAQKIIGSLMCIYKIKLNQNYLCMYVTINFESTVTIYVWLTVNCDEHVSIITTD